MSDDGLEEQIACVRRELAMRDRVYPAWVRSGKMSQATAAEEISRMRSVLASLERLAGNTATQRSGGHMKEGDYIICRTYSAGVFAGTLVSREGREVTLRDARRLWYWAGAASLSELSVRGVTRPDECKFPVAVPEVVLLEAIELLPVSDRARMSIEAVPEWSANE